MRKVDEDEGGGGIYSNTTGAVSTYSRGRSPLSLADKAGSLIAASAPVANYWSLYNKLDVSHSIIAAIRGLQDPSQHLRYICC